jgi:hypothetical protein
MKNLISKAMGVIAGLIALFGISAANVTAAVPDISSKSALYLEHGKYMGSSVDTVNGHHSHHSHESHTSHSSGY